MNDAVVRLQVQLDSSSAEKKVQTLSDKMSTLGSKMSNVGRNMTIGLTAPIIGGFGYAIKQASDFNETMNKVDVAFGSNAKEVKKWGNTTIKKFGMAKGTALDAAALYGDMATGMGLNTKEASTLGMGLTGLAGDLASFKNVSQDVAKTALAGVFTGETESLKGLGIIMTETNLEQFALSKGITKSVKDMTQAEKIQLRYAYVTEMSKNAVGDYARTSEGTANQTRSAGEQFKELSATLGQQLLPIFNAIIKKVSGLMTWFNNLNGKTKAFILIALGIIAVVGPLLIFIGAITSAITAITAATWLWNASLLSNPITWIIVGIIALIAVIALVIKNFDKIKVWFIGFGSWIEFWWNKLVGSFKAFGSAIGNAIGGAIKGTINFILRGVFNTINNFLSLINATLKFINKIPGVNIPKLKMLDVPQLATGTNNIARDGLAYLHQGEAVVPKKYNPANGGFGGTQTITIQMPEITMDGNRIARTITPFVTKTIKVSGGNV